MAAKKTKKAKKKTPEPQEQQKYDIEPWDRQDNETAKAFAAFRCYRDMGAARSLRKVAESIYKNLGKPAANVRYIEHWSSKFKWVPRVDAWDTERDRIERAEQEQAVRTMKRRLAEQAVLVQTKGLQRMLDMDPGELTKREALDYFAKGVEIEGKNREVPDLKIEHSGHIKTTEHGLERTIAEDPETREMLDELLTRFATNQSGGVRIPGEQREMDSS
ncbi:MAG: hypothetical protein HF975_04335 [ANME-2 cluster archaeon]|nr:hypothetical protein [ANME-2 cluster archaeon]